MAEEVQLLSVIESVFTCMYFSGIHTTIGKHMQPHFNHEYSSGHDNQGHYSIILSSKRPEILSSNVS